MYVNGRFTIRRSIPAVKAPDNHWRGGWVGLKAGLDSLEKRKIYCCWREAYHDDLSCFTHKKSTFKFLDYFWKELRRGTVYGIGFVNGQRTVEWALHGASVYQRHMISYVWRNICRGHHHSVTSEGNLCESNRIVKLVRLALLFWAGRAASCRRNVSCL